MLQEKLQTLRTIYELVRNEELPALRMVNPREIILRLDFGWDIIVTHLNELKQDGLVEILQMNVAQITLTPRGLEQAMAIVHDAAA